MTLKALREAASTCRACDLYKYATQTVFGEGRARAPLMFVGEQPGDSEDRLGHPFVGPAGKSRHEAMARAGIQAKDVYVTNAVKHFKFVERGNAESITNRRSSKYAPASRGSRPRSPSCAPH